MNLIEVIQPTSSSTNQNLHQSTGGSGSNLNDVPRNIIQHHDLHQAGELLRQRLAIDSSASLEPTMASPVAPTMTVTAAGEAIERRSLAIARIGSSGASEDFQLRHHHLYPHNKHHQSSSSLPPSQGNDAGNNVVSNLVLQYVNLNLVRDMIVQHAIELVLILVIVTYLIYYFAKISSVSKVN